ncbi:hypothetical protein [Croceicoccus sp. YJ47]|uniref:hypothetical protein n=1 Tax=Croceicoccus sp. YJ47 TaxID=2798724 RepID=UPI0019209531|nr:hypothetical protein [Croceicoccus sp. YJ47]QQN75044.1 hypothetical protein JD971_04930 [Croceicoccus sp. YJ47]
MTVASDRVSHSYRPGGAMAPESLSGLVFKAASDLIVTREDDATGLPRKLSAGRDYVISGDGAAGAATITATGVWPDDTIWHVERRTFAQQQARIIAHKPLPADALEAALDHAVMAAQEARDTSGRGFRFAPNEPGFDIPSRQRRRSAFPGFDYLGDPVLLQVGDFRGAKGEPGGNVMAVGLATDLWGVSVPPGTDIVSTSGHDTPGIGAALYVADDLADADLLAAHPRFVFQTANGRIFRLRGDGSALTAEQMGARGAIGPGLAAANCQPALAAGVRYMEAVGIGQMAMTKPYYQPWAPYRVSDPEDQFAQDGIHFVHTRPISIVSTCGGTTMDYRTFNGGDPRTEWQVVNGKIWRGVGHQLVRKLERPDDPSEYAALHLHDMHLYTTTKYTGQGFWPADPVTGDGWDNQSHKFVQMQPDGFNEGEVRVTGTSSIVGWRGECFYLASGSTGIFDGNIRIAETNGQAINPNDVRKLIVRGNVLIENCYFSIEGKGGEGSIVQCTIRNTKGGHLQGGAFNFDPSRNYWPASARPGEKAPIMQVDVNQYDSRIGIFSNVQGRIKSVDSSVTVDTTALSVVNGQVAAPADAHTIDLELHAWADRSSDHIPLTLFGINDDSLGLATGQRGIHDCRFKVHCYRTERAIAEGKYFASAVQYGGSIGERVIIEDGSGESLTGVALAPATVVRDFHPLFRGNRFRSTQPEQSMPSVNLQNNSAFAIIGDQMVLRSHTPGDIYAWINGAVPFSVATDWVQDGQELTLYNFQTGSFPMLAFNRFDNRLARAVIPPGASMTLAARVVSGALAWTITRPPPPLTNARDIDFASVLVPAGGVSAPQSISVTGAHNRLRGDVTFAGGAMGDDFEIVQVRCTPDEVRFRLRNNGDAEAQPPTGEYQATARGQEQ